MIRHCKIRYSQLIFLSLEIRTHLLVSVVHDLEEIATKSRMNAVNKVTQRKRDLSQLRLTIALCLVPCLPHGIISCSASVSVSVS